MDEATKHSGLNDQGQLFRLFRKMDEFKMLVTSEVGRTFPPPVPTVEVVTWRVSTRLLMSWTRTWMTACLRMR